MTIWVVAAIVGYVLGMLNPASLIARVRRIDLRRIGSGNPGATNVGRALGVRWGVLVAVLDMLKGFVPAYVFFVIGGFPAGEIAGVAAVVGHITSPLLRGRGGKGVATALGAILGVAPWLALIVLVVFVIGVAVLRRIGLASVVAAICLSIAGIMSVELAWYPPSVAIFATVIAVLVLLRHGRNVREALRPQRPESTSTGEDERAP